MECLATCGSREEDLIAGCEVCAGRGKCPECVQDHFISKGSTTTSCLGLLRVLSEVQSFVWSPDI